MIEDWRYSDENLEKRSLCLLCCIHLDEEINTSIYEFCHYFTSNGLFGDLLPTDESPKTEELKKHGGDIVAMMKPKVKSELESWRLVYEEEAAIRQESS